MSERIAQRDGDSVLIGFQTKEFAGRSLGMKCNKIGRTEDLRKMKRAIGRNGGSVFGGGKRWNKIEFIAMEDCLKIGKIDVMLKVFIQCSSTQGMQVISN